MLVFDASVTYSGGQISIFKCQHRLSSLIYTQEVLGYKCLYISHANITVTIASQFFSTRKPHVLPVTINYSSAKKDHKAGEQMITQQTKQNNKILGNKYEQYWLIIVIYLFLFS